MIENFFLSQISQQDRKWSTGKFLYLGCRYFIPLRMILSMPGEVQILGYPESCYLMKRVYSSSYEWLHYFGEVEKIEFLFPLLISRLPCRRLKDCFTLEIWYMKNCQTLSAYSNTWFRCSWPITFCATGCFR